MPSTKQLAVDPWLKILLTSPPGKGKTSLAGTARQLGRMYIMDTDQRLAVLAGLDIDYDTYFDPDPKNPQGYFRAWRKLEALEKKLDYSIVCLDGLTTFNSLVMNKAMSDVDGMMNMKRLGGANGPKVPGLPDYNAFKTYITNFVQKLVALPCHVIVTAHEEADKDELTQVAFVNLAVPGKSSAVLPGYFNEVWRMEVEMKDGKPVYKVRTRPTNLASSRTSYPKALNTYEEPDIGKIYGKITQWLAKEHSQAQAEVAHDALTNQKKNETSAN